jgi:hypothetical protein
VRGFASKFLWLLSPTSGPSVNQEAVVATGSKRPKADGILELIREAHNSIGPVPDIEAGRSGDKL